MRKKYQEAGEDKSSASDLYRVTGRFPYEKYFVGFNCLYFSYQMFILCEEIVVEIEKIIFFFKMHQFIFTLNVNINSSNRTKIFILLHLIKLLELPTKNIGDRLNNISAWIIDFDQERDIFFKAYFEVIFYKFYLAESDVDRKFWKIKFYDLEALNKGSSF